MLGKIVIPRYCTEVTRNKYYISHNFRIFPFLLLFSHLQTSQWASKCWSTVRQQSRQDWSSITGPPPATTPFTATVATGDRITDEEEVEYLAAVVNGGGGVITSAAEATEVDERRRAACCFLVLLAAGVAAPPPPPPRRPDPLPGAVVAVRGGFFCWLHSGTVRLSGSSLLSRSWYWAIFCRRSAFNWRAASPS